MVEDFSLIETALVPFRGFIVCDGLIVNKNILLGKNMIKKCRVKKSTYNYDVYPFLFIQAQTVAKGGIWWYIRAFLGIENLDTGDN